MQDPDSKSKGPQAQIAEAIRAKRERRTGSAIKAELDAMEASLLADIDSFDLDAAARQVLDAEKKIQTRGLAVDPSMEFPDIVAEGAAPRTSSTPRTSTAAGASRLDLGASDLLGQLRHEAEACQQLLDVEHRQLSVLETVADRALRHVFAYLHELVQQLNVIHPPIPRVYPVAGSSELRNLNWEQGFVDYRTLPQSAGAALESVSFTFRLVGEKGVELEREGAVAENFRKTLFDFNLNVKVEEFRNSRHYLERARFIVAPEVKVNVRWEWSPEEGKIMVLTRNLERLGANRYPLAPEAVDQALLDEFGRLVLGRPHQFSRRVSR